MNTLATLQPPPSLIAGCGDVGVRVARLLLAQGGKVQAMVRDPRRLAELESLGVDPLLADLDRPQDVGDRPWLFWFAPPRTEGERDERLRHWLAAQTGTIDRLVYISTSAVYGDCQGRWIDEDEPVRPDNARGRRRADAEAALHEWALHRGTAVMVLRVPGIYGPGRLPIERLRQGLPVLRDADAPFTNRIHADDLARAAILAAWKGIAGHAYNIADGHPSTMADYFTRCAELLGLPMPEAVDRDEAQRRLTPAMWSFMQESKRLRIDRARRELGFVPDYPDLSAGLPSCLPG